MPRRSWEKIKVQRISLVVALSMILLVPLAIAWAQGGNAQALAVKPVPQVRGTRVDIWTAQRPSGYVAISGHTAVCTTQPLCTPTAGFFETGYVKGTITDVDNVLQQYVGYANVDGGVVSVWGLGNLSDNTWYTFQTLYSNTAQRWEAWRNGQVIYFPPSALNFTYGARVSCGSEGNPDGVPLATECENMRYKPPSGKGWIQYDYTTIQVTQPPTYTHTYCVFSRHAYNAVGWGPC